MSNNLFKGVVKLSQEQFDTLKSTGTLTVNGETITYSPDDTVYAVGDNISEQVSNNTSDIEQLQTDISSLETELTNKLDKNQGVENAGKILGIEDTGNISPIDMPEQGVIELVGTQENPIHLGTDIELGKLYFISGWYRTYSSTARELPTEGNKYLCYAIGIDSLNRKSIVIFGCHVSGTLSKNVNEGSGTIITTGDGYGNGLDYFSSLSSLNGNFIPLTTRIYAPTNSGTTGQILQSNGTNNAPTWIDNISVDSELSETSTNPVQNNIITVGLHQIEESIPTTLAELADDSTHRLVTDAEKSTWNSKSDFSGSYNDLTDKPIIPTDNSQLTNGAGYVTETTVNSAVATKTAVNVGGELQQTVNFDSDPQTQIDNLTNKGIAVYIDEGATSITQEQLEILQANDNNYIVYANNYILKCFTKDETILGTTRYYECIYSSIGTDAARLIGAILFNTGFTLIDSNISLTTQNNRITTSSSSQNVSSNTNNYVRYGDVLIQWGHAHCDRDTNMTLTFGYPFADANYSIVVMNGDSSAWAAYLNGFKLEGSAAGGSGIGKTSTGCTISQYNYENDFEWIAIGRG